MFFLALFNLSTQNDTHTHNDKHNIHNDTHLLTGTHTDVIITDKKNIIHRITHKFTYTHLQTQTHTNTINNNTRLHKQSR